MKLNINDAVRVKVQPRGREAYSQHFTKLGLPAPVLATDAEGYTTMALWAVMYYFGDACYMGPEPPIATTIYLDEVTLPPCPCCGDIVSCRGCEWTGDER